MALNELSPNVSLSYTYDSPAVGPPGGLRRTTPLNSSTAKKSARRRSPRLLPLQPPPPTDPRPSIDAAAAAVDDGDRKPSAGRPTPCNPVATGLTDELAFLRNELAAAKEDAIKYKSIVDSVRDVLATSSASAAEDTVSQLCSMLEIEEPKQQSASIPDSCADEAGLISSPLPQDDNAVKHEQDHARQIEPLVDDVQESHDEMNNVDGKAKLVLDDEKSAPKPKKNKDKSRRRTFAIQGDTLLLAKPLPSLDQHKSSPDDDCLMSESKPSSGDRKAVDVEQCIASEEAEAPKDEADESYDGAAAVASGICTKGATEEVKPDLISEYSRAEAESGIMKSSLEEAKKKRDKKQRRRTIALAADSLLKASPVMSSSPKPSDSAEKSLPPTSSSSSTVAVNVASSKQNILDSGGVHTDAGKVAGGETSDSTPLRKEKIRRSTRRRTMALQGDTLLLSSSGSNTPDVGSDKSNEEQDGETPLHQPPILPSPVQKKSETSAPWPTKSATETIAPTLPVEASKPPLGPKKAGGTRKSRRKSILPERLRRDDVILDPSLTPNAPRAPSDNAAAGERSEVQSSTPLSTAILAERTTGSETKEGASASSASASQKEKKKRRRRSSIGLAGGGAITPQEMEALAPKLKKRSALLSSDARKRHRPTTSDLRPEDTRSYSNGIKPVTTAASVSKIVRESPKPNETGHTPAGPSENIPTTAAEQQQRNDERTTAAKEESGVLNGGTASNLDAVLENESCGQGAAQGGVVQPVEEELSNSAVLAEGAMVKDSSAEPRNDAGLIRLLESGTANGGVTNNLDAILEDELPGNGAVPEDVVQYMEEEPPNSAQNSEEEPMHSSEVTIKPEEVPINRELPVAGSRSVSDEEDPLGLRSLVTATTSGAQTNPPEGVIQLTEWGDIDISAKDIRTRITQLFPGTDALIEPCVSARLFACASLVMEKRSKAEEGGRRTLRSQPASQFKHVLPLLNAFVQAELVSASGDRKSEASSNRQRTLLFCSFDYSSTMPPVDRKTGSHAHLEKSILSLGAVLKEIDVLREQTSGLNIDEEKAKEINDNLNVIISTLQRIETDSTGDLLRDECSESMPFLWPAQRFVKAAQSYRQEFQEARSIMADACNYDEMELESGLRHKLGDFIGRAIRFYLRRFFDPVPLTLTNSEHENYRHVDLSVVRSRIHELVEMTNPEGAERDTAAADGSISSVFSFALRAIYELFALNAAKAGDGEFFSAFFTSGASIRGLGTSRNSPIVLTDHDLEEILTDIHNAHVCLAGARAGKFVRALMHWPGVTGAIEEAGGWGKVEGFAKMFKNSLESACPDEAYFTLLDNVGGLLRTLDNDAAKMEQLEKTCEENLRLIWKRFRCGTKSKQILHQNPKISIIAEYLRDGKQLVFPDLAEPSEESEEE